MAGRGFRRVGPESGAAWWAAVRSARRLRRVVDAVQLRGQVSAVSLLPEAVWWVDAATVTGDRLVDLTGSGRDLLFGPPGGEPVTLPHDGLTYLHIPTAGQGVQIAAPEGTAWMATRLDGSIVAGVTDADPWLFDVPGDWQQIASDDGWWICVPSLHQNGYSEIVNLGTAGGVWTVERAAAGLACVVVDRPLVLFGGDDYATATDPLPGDGTRIRYRRAFGVGGGIGGVVSVHDGSAPTVDGVIEEFVADAIWPRTLTADQIEQATLELAGSPRTVDAGPHTARQVARPLPPPFNPLYPAADLYPSPILYPRSR